VYPVFLPIQQTVAAEMLSEWANLAPSFLVVVKAESTVETREQMLFGANIVRFPFPSGRGNSAPLSGLDSRWPLGTASVFLVAVKLGHPTLVVFPLPVLCSCFPVVEEGHDLLSSLCFDLFLFIYLLLICMVSFNC